MRRLLPALVLTALACAPSVPTPEPTRVLATDESGAVYRTTNDNLGADMAVAAPAARVEAALLAAYADLGIPATTLAGAVGRVGNSNLQASRTLSGQPMSSYFDCGSSITGPRTNRVRMTISLVSSYVAAGDTTRVRTLMEGQGRDLADGSSTDLISCRSTGRLERLVNERAQARLRTGG